MVFVLFIIIYLFDASKQYTQKEIADIDILTNKSIIKVINKIDINKKLNFNFISKQYLKISALKKIGLKKLENEIFSKLVTNTKDANC